MVGETWENWRENVRRTLELSPESVTIYQMELPFNTVYSKGLLETKQESSVATWQTKRDWVRFAFEEFQSAGYSISSAYTVVKDPSKVNFSYRDNLWRADLLATGLASFRRPEFTNKACKYQQYINILLEENRLPLGRAYQPSPLQCLIREMILQMKKGYLDVGYFNTKYEDSIVDRWQSEWNDLVREGFANMIEGDDGRVTRIELTMDGLLCVDGLLPRFFEENLRGTLYMSELLTFAMGSSLPSSPPIDCMSKIICGLNRWMVSLSIWFFRVRRSLVAGHLLYRL